MRMSKIIKFLPYAFSSVRDPHSTLGNDEILGISINATQEEIKTAYYKKVKQHHPDVSGTTSAAKFDQVRKAFLDLSNPSSKHNSKQQQATGFQGWQERTRSQGQKKHSGHRQYGEQKFYHWEEKQFERKNRRRERQEHIWLEFQQEQLKQFVKAFESYIRNGYVKPKYEKYRPFMGADAYDFQDQQYEAEQQFQQEEFNFTHIKNKHKMRKLDISYHLKIKQEQLGQQIKIKYQRQVCCPRCQFNSQRNYSKKPCKESQNGREHDKNCKKCRGKGFTIKYQCKQCDNKGTVMRNVEQVIVVPLGIENGQIMTINGRGHQNKRKGTFGDLIVQVEFSEGFSSKKSKQRNSRSNEVDIDIFEAVLGCTTNVKSSKGTTQFNIPAGTQHGAIVKNRSVNPHRDLKQIKVNLVIPMSISSQERQLYEKLRKIDSEKSSL